MRGQETECRDRRQGWKQYGKMKHNIGMNQKCIYRNGILHIIKKFTDKKIVIVLIKRGCLGVLLFVCAGWKKVCFNVLYIYVEINIYYILSAKFKCKLMHYKCTNCKYIFCPVLQLYILLVEQIIVIKSMFFSVFMQGIVSSKYKVVCNCWHYSNNMLIMLVSPSSGAIKSLF